MKINTPNGIIKKLLISFIVLIMIINFIMPSYVHADEDEGGKLFTPITALLLGMTDRVEATLESIFIGKFTAGDVLGGESLFEEAPDEAGKILNFGPWDGKVEVYHVRYSPGVIFSGKVPALDVNFISPMTDEETTFDVGKYEFKELVDKIKWSEVQDTYNAPADISIRKGSTIGWLTIGTTDVYYSMWSYNGETYYFVYDREIEGYLFGTSVGISTMPILGVFGAVLGPINSLLQAMTEPKDPEGTLYRYEKVGTDLVKKESTAANLQPLVRKYYLALRTFALVGLLSVLVYIGIRIILSSTSSQQQAKYKTMLKDWLVAICILFMMHYMMAFILEITDNVTHMFSMNTIMEEETDRSRWNGISCW